MAQHWGRKETIIWPPHAPIVSYGAIAAALLLTCLLMWQRLKLQDVSAPAELHHRVRSLRSWSPVQSSRELQAGDAGRSEGKAQACPARRSDQRHQPTLPNGKTVPIGISDLAAAQGYAWVLPRPGDEAAGRRNAPLASGRGLREPGTFRPVRGEA